MHFEHSQKAQDYLARVKAFMKENVYPIEERIYAELEEMNPTGDWKNWKLHPELEALKVKAREQGLANLF